MRSSLLILLLVSVAHAESPKSRYLHATHDKVGIKLTCDVCHGIAPSMSPTFPGANEHKPCANQACHKMEFERREPTLCFACHESNKPWGENPVRHELRDQSEFRVAFSHANHLGRAEGGKLLGQGCASCHPGQAGEAEPRRTVTDPAPQHKWCGSCHEQLSKPSMHDCGGCHQLRGAPPGPTADNPWSVAARFSHDAHRADVRTARPLTEAPAALGWARFDAASAQPLACESCHAGMAQVGAGDTAARPKMADCAACHDGDHAFKVTGFDCAKCHGGGTLAAAPPGGAP